MATIEQLEARLAELEARLPPVPITQVNPPVTIGELADVPAPGSAIASAWTQEVTRRITHRFATIAARDAAYPAAGAGAGAICITLDSGTIWAVIGAAWAAVGGARLGGTWARAANQSIANGGISGIGFDTETADIGGFAAPMPVSTFVVPPGASGIYSGTFSYTFGAAIANAYGQITAGSRPVARVATEAQTGLGVVTFAGVPLAAGEAITPAIYQLSGGPRNMTGFFDMYRTGT